MFIKDVAKIASRVSGIKGSVLCFRKLSSVTNEEKFHFTEDEIRDWQPSMKRYV